MDAPTLPKMAMRFEDITQTNVDLEELLNEQCIEVVLGTLAKSLALYTPSVT